MVAPSGARRGKADHPALPISIPEIADRICGTCADNGTQVPHILDDVDHIALLRGARSTGVVRADRNEVIYVDNAASVASLKRQLQECPA